MHLKEYYYDLSNVKCSLQQKTPTSLDKNRNITIEIGVGKQTINMDQKFVNQILSAINYFAKYGKLPNNVVKCEEEQELFTYEDYGIERINEDRI